MLEETINSLTEAIKALTEALNKPLPKGLQESAPGPAKAEKKAAVPAKVKPEPEPTPEPDAPQESSTSPNADAVNMTADQVRAKLLPLVQAKGPAIVKNALESLGAALLSELTPAQYPALLDHIDQAVAQEG